VGSTRRTLSGLGAAPEQPPSRVSHQPHGEPSPYRSLKAVTLGMSPSGHELNEREDDVYRVTMEPQGSSKRWRCGLRTRTCDGRLHARHALKTNDTHHAATGSRCR
jgi:hypothetical protein